MGLGCGRPIPGVYADITQGLCFIHAATKCIQGDKYEKYYYYPQCDDWLDTLVARYVFKYVLITMGTQTIRIGISKTQLL